MSPLQLLATFAGAGFLLVNPTLAQSPTATQPALRSEASVPAGSLERVQNAWPVRNLMGASVFNDSGQRVAAVRDLLLADDGKVDRVVLAVGRRGRLIAVVFGQLRFVPSQRFETPELAVRGRMSRMGSAGRPDAGGSWRRASTRADRSPYGIMIPGVTEASLLKMESFQVTP